VAGIAAGVGVWKMGAVQTWASIRYSQNECHMSTELRVASGTSDSSAQHDHICITGTPASL
jgi:hypothetical protein